MIHWNTITLSPLPLLRRFLNQEICSKVQSGATAAEWNFDKFPCHTQAVERYAKLANCQKKRRKHAANISDHSAKIEPENFPDFLVMRMFFLKRLFLSSDPVLTGMRPTMRKTSKSFLKETLEMLLPMEFSEVLDGEDSDHEETDNDINNLSSDE
ncbi:hypothetical protein AVEN_273287-1 [Araneus ventricosus]|uniref:Uncharacterized protein n=1 Tax=Araneus ventricosus TaxID=182803 RepID=A0A4Y2RWZ0_ARAVE|nr:hypothetical protein AVEN_273287-1 [Araneus ventricosus]